jgi:hypothetical protein
MGQVGHGSATTTHAVRAAIQRSQASLATLSRELGINPKSVAKWRKRATVEDLKTGPKAPHSTTLTEAEEAMVVAFRRHTFLPLDDCLYALQPSIPHLTRSALHRCLQRHGISSLPDIEGDKPRRQRFKRYPIGFFHVDIAEVQTDGGLYSSCRIWAEHRAMLSRIAAATICRSRSSGSARACGHAPGSPHQSAANPLEPATPLRSDRPGSNRPPKGSLESSTSRRVNQFVHAA